MRDLTQSLIESREDAAALRTAPAAIEEPIHRGQLLRVEFRGVFVDDANSVVLGHYALLGP